TITNSIVYPLTRALYGMQVRQPIGGDFGFSGKLAQFYLSKDVWETDVARFGIDIWMTTTAIANDFKVAQSFLGAKIHDAKDPGTDLGNMLYQVVSATFQLMEDYAPVWMPVRGSSPVPTFGFEYTVGLEHVNVNTARMLALFREGLLNLRDIWGSILGEGDLKEVERLGTLDDASFRFPLELWTRVIYDYAIAFHQKRLPAEHLIKSLLPLYIGKTASFVMEVDALEAHEAEAEIDKLCLAFERGKDYLCTCWK
ncbi:MAG: glycosyl transferase family 2, partial [Gammaproteobacteria bacterium]|nr:glycosyl transferase family 2 [Gammaproteobacteria bacterium]